MIDAFSMRAKQIVFAARFRAGERGANLIDVEDFLLGLVLEDQEMLGKNLFSKLHDGHGTVLDRAPSHVPFFSQEEAKNLVTSIEALQTQSKPIGPLSPALERAFGSAKDFQVHFHHSQIEPLHLLAGILTEESSQGVTLLQEFGITREKVLQQLRSATEN